MEDNIEVKGADPADNPVADERVNTPDTQETTATDNEITSPASDAEIAGGDQPEEQVSTLRKTLEIIKNVAVWVIFAISIGVMVFTLISSAFFNQQGNNNKMSLFGLKFYIVRSDSMKGNPDAGEGRESYFSAGDLIVCLEVDPKTLVPGDVITFMSMNSIDSIEDEMTYGKVGATVTHRIREKVEDGKGGYAFRTYGTTTGVNDKTLVEPAEVYAKYLFMVPLAGHFFAFLKTVPGYIVCILIPFLIIILSQGVNFVRLFRRYRAEQLSEMREERERLEADKLENKRMMEELLALKAQLMQSGMQSQPDAPPTEATVAAPIIEASAPIEEKPASVPNTASATDSDPTAE